MRADVQRWMGTGRVGLNVVRCGVGHWVRKGETQQRFVGMCLRTWCTTSRGDCTSMSASSSKGRVSVGDDAHIQSRGVWPTNKQMPMCQHIRNYFADVAVRRWVLNTFVRSRGNALPIYS